MQLAFTSACISQEQLASEVKLGLSYILKFNGVANDLKLTGEQVGQINKIKSSLESGLQGFLDHARAEQLTQNEIGEEVRALRAQHEKELPEILTEEKRAKLKEHEGDPFQEQRGPPTQTDK